MKAVQNSSAATAGTRATSKPPSPSPRCPSRRINAREKRASVPRSRRPSETSRPKASRRRRANPRSNWPECARACCVPCVGCYLRACFESIMNTRNFQVTIAQIQLCRHALTRRSCQTQCRTLYYNATCRLACVRSIFEIVARPCCHTSRKDLDIITAQNKEL